MRRICHYFILIYISVRWLYNLVFRDGRSKTLTCLTGKTAIVTGGNSGIGYAVSTLLASRGCRVIIADVNNSENSRNRIIERTGNKNVLWKHLDLASLSSIRAFAKDLTTSEGKIDILINNAGVGLSKTKVTGDNLNNVMQVNYFGGFLLTHLLVDCLKAAPGARLIFASSVQGYYSTLTPENLDTELNPVDFDVEEVATSWGLYCNSKLCNMFAAQEFGKRLRKYNVTVNSADPGAVTTELFIQGDDFNVWYMKLVRRLKFYRIILHLVGQDNFGGAQTIFHLATSNQLETTSGENYFRCEPFPKPAILKNKKFCEDLWSKTEKIIKLNANEKL